MEEEGKAPRKTYSKEFKLQIVKLKLEGGYSKYRIVREFGITRAMVERWVKRYQSEGEDGLESRRGRPKKRTFDRPRTQVEQLEARVRYLEMENAILKKLKDLEGRDAGKR